jgi:hypothetical protein
VEKEKLFENENYERKATKKNDKTIDRCFQGHGGRKKYPQCTLFIF